MDEEYRSVSYKAINYIGPYTMPVYNTYLKSEFLGSRTFSRSFLSSLSATISAALPRGHLMMGTAPVIQGMLISHEKQHNIDYFHAHCNH